MNDNLIISGKNSEIQYFKNIESTKAGPETAAERIQMDKISRIYSYYWVNIPNDISLNCGVISA